MQFRLLYSGELRGASKNNTRAEMKHAVRRQFHPQLRRLWKANSAIRESLATQVDPLRNVGPLRHSLFGKPKSTDELIDIGINQIADKYQRFGYRFVPLVTEELSVRCSIDVLFLRPQASGLLMEGGDLVSRPGNSFT
jgi:hypothetical protein